MSRWLHANIARILALFAVALVAAVYFPLTRVYFISDDFANMLRIVNRGALHFLFEPFGGHMLFLRNALFIVHYELFGLHAEPYGWFVLVTHLVNVVLVLRVTAALTRSPALGAFAAVLWGASHMQDGALGWYSVYGQVVVATLFLIVLERVATRQTDATVPPRTAAGWAALLLLGSTAFGTGIAVGLVAPLVILLLLPSAFRDRRAGLIVGLVPGAVVGLYVASRWLFFQFEPMPPSEAMVVSVAFSSLTPTLVMFAHLCAIGASGLLHGFAIPVELFHPAPAADPFLVSVYALCVLGALAGGKPATRRQLAALLLAAAAVYGLIALGRANSYLMWQTPPSVSARTGRYHYVGTMPLAIAFAVALGEARRLFRAAPPFDAAVLAGWSGFLCWSYATSSFRVDERKDSRASVMSTLEDIRARVRSAPPGADVYIPNTPLPVYVTAFMGYEGVPGPAALFALMYPTDTLDGHRVRFIEPPEEKGMFADPKNRRLASLIVPATGAPR